MLVSPCRNHSSSCTIERRCSFLVVTSGKPSAQVEAHLPAEHAARAGAGAVGLVACRARARARSRSRYGCIGTAPAAASGDGSAGCSVGARRDNHSQHQAERDQRQAQHLAHREPAEGEVAELLRRARARTRPGSGTRRTAARTSPTPRSAAAACARYHHSTTNITSPSRKAWYSCEGWRANRSSAPACEQLAQRIGAIVPVAAHPATRGNTTPQPRVGQLAPQLAADEVAEPAEAQPRRHQRRDEIQRVARGAGACLRDHHHTAATHAEQAAVETHAAFPHLAASCSGSREEVAEGVEQDVAEAAAEHDAEHPVEHQVAEAAAHPRPAGARRARVGCPSHQATAKPSRYIRPYQWILSGPSGEARSGRSGAGTVRWGKAGIRRRASPNCATSGVQRKRGLLGSSS